MAFAEPWLESILKRFYNRCDALVAPSESMADVLREQGMSSDIEIWSRGVDRDIFDPSRRDLEWRRSLGIEDEDVVVGFLGRLLRSRRCGGFLRGRGLFGLLGTTATPPDEQEHRSQHQLSSHHGHPPPGKDLGKRRLIYSTPGACARRGRAGGGGSEAIEGAGSDVEDEADAVPIEVGQPRPNARLHLLVGP